MLSTTPLPQWSESWTGSNDVARRGFGALRSRFSVLKGAF